MSDMYGIVICMKCGRKRIADIGCKTSVCPYCSSSSPIYRMTVLFSDEDQSVVRKVFESADSSKYPDPKKRSVNDPDPLSTLIYEYEHTSGTPEKLALLAAGLTKIYGDFIEDDVETSFPGKGEQMIRMMISLGVVIELGYGRYRAV